MLTCVESSDHEVAPNDVKAIVDATDIESVVLNEIHGGPVASAGMASSLNVTLDPRPPQFLVTPDGMSLLVRITHSLDFQDSDDDDPGASTNLTLVHEVRFAVTADLEATRADISAFIETNVYFMVYPYVRQLVTSLTADMGIPPIVLGYMKREEMVYNQGQDLISE